ncbi:MAG: hypothetical protein FJ161_05070 [Gammaproteobacteria bacterium]|nr:hypothetical protein [Gammaproteobacteria bacterium]
MMPIAVPSLSADSKNAAEIKTLNDAECAKTLNAWFEQWRKETAKSKAAHERQEIFKKIINASAQARQIRRLYEEYLAKIDKNLYEIFEEEYFKRHEKERPKMPSPAEKWEKSRVKEICDRQLYNMEAYSMGLIGVIIGAAVVFQGHMIGYAIHRLIEIHYFMHLKHATPDELAKMLAYMLKMCGQNDTKALDDIFRESGSLVISWTKIQEEIESFNPDTLAEYEDLNPWTQSLKKQATEQLITSAEDACAFLAPHMISLLYLGTRSAVAAHQEMVKDGMHEDEAKELLKCKLGYFISNNKLDMSKSLYAARIKLLYPGTNDVLFTSSYNKMNAEDKLILEEQCSAEGALNDVLHGELLAVEHLKASASGNFQNPFESLVSEHIAAQDRTQRKALIKAFGWESNTDKIEAKHNQMISSKNKLLLFYQGRQNNRAASDMVSTINATITEENKIQEGREYNARQFGFDCLEMVQEAGSLGLEVISDYIHQKPGAEDQALMQQRMRMGAPKLTRRG